MLNAHKAFSFLFAIFLFTNLSACSSNDDDSDTSSNVPPNGFFVDANVNALSYASPSYSGQTQTAGNFPFKEGETTTFSFKGLVLGSVTMALNKPTITPFELFNTTDIEDQRVKNVLVLLQTLDNDQNPENGISLPNSDDGISGDYLSGLDLASANFQADLQPILDNEFGPGSYVVVEETVAQQHFQETLALLNGVPDFISKTWVTRTQEFGDVSAEYTFNADGTLEVTEYEGCPSNLWAATLGSLIANCPDTNELLFTWSLVGDELTMSTDAFTDTCYLQFVRAEYITAVCNFYGSGLGNELIIFENTADIRAADLVTGISPERSFAVYDGDTGTCKNYYNFNSSTKHVNIQQNEGSEYICSHNGLVYPESTTGPGTTESGANYNIYSYSGSSTITISEISRSCNPIYTQAFLSNYAHLMYCTENGGQTVFYEIWKTF